MNRTDICNLALSYINKGRINSLEDTSEEAKQCSIHYDHTRRRLLRMYSWGFAKRIVKLAQRRETMPGWKYCYGYPEACLSVRYIYDEAGANHKEDRRPDYEILATAGYDRVIATNVELAYAEYLYDVTEPELFSEEFIEALARLLAASLCLPLTGSTSLQANNLQLAQQAIDTAKYQSAIEKEQRTKYPKKYANARFS